MAQVWTREKVRQVLEVLSKLPDYDSFPVPESICKEYNIPFTPAKALSLKEYMAQHRKTRLEHVTDVEEKSGDGILRPVSTELPITITVCPPEDVDKYLIKDQNDDETHQEPHSTEETSKEATCSKLQES